MRKLKTSDIPAFCRCLKNIGVKEEFKRIAQNSDNLQDAWSAGYEIIWNIFDLATEKKSEKYLYEFLADIFEVPAKDLADLPLDEFVDGIKQIAEENNLASFFSFAVKSMT